MHCSGETTPRRLQLTAIANQSVRSNFQVGHNIAIAGTVAATKFGVTGVVGATGDGSDTGFNPQRSSLEDYRQRLAFPVPKRRLPRELGV